MKRLDEKFMTMYVRIAFDFLKVAIKKERPILQLFPGRAPDRSFGHLPGSQKPFQDANQTSAERERIHDFWLPGET